jgi:hypothetical protein
MNKEIVTERHKLAPKPFTWSYSGLTSFETCPKRHYHLKVKKRGEDGFVEEQKTPELDRGDALHKAMYSRILSGTKLPVQFLYMEKWAERLAKVVNPLQITQCELKLALSRDYQGTGYFDKSTWLRIVIDYLKITPASKPGTFLAHAVDYKTGKPKDGSEQLALYAAVIFALYKDVVGVRCDYLWSEYNDTSHETYTRDDVPEVWRELLPRVSTMEAAVAAGKFPAKPGGLCREYCPIRTCEHNGKRIKA